MDYKNISERRKYSLCSFSGYLYLTYVHGWKNKLLIINIWNPISAKNLGMSIILNN